MQSLRRALFLFGAIILAGVPFGQPQATPAQDTGHVVSSTADLPDAPGLRQSPQDDPSATSAPPQAQSQPQSQHDRAEQQMRQAEHQRILGVMPNFESTSNRNAPPLSRGQKFHLAFHSAIDPFAFVTAALDAGVSQAENNFPGYGQGTAGYARRYGAAYADSFDGTMLGNAVFPALLRQDPRYFRQGTGSFASRLLHAVESTVWCRNDNGAWGPNFSNVSGNLVAGGISNIYYPASDRGIGLTFQRAFTVTAEGGLGAIGNEFWPDVSRRFLHNRGSGTTPANSMSTESNNN